MKRVTTIEYSEAEHAALLFCESAARQLRVAESNHDQAILGAVRLGLPTREVAKWANVSSAHVSRLNNGLYGNRDE